MNRPPTTPPASLPERYGLLDELGQSTYRVADRERGGAALVLRILGPSEGPRVRRELSRLLELEDAHLARILELGELEDGRTFYVQELVEGEDLFQWALGRDASEVVEVWAQLVRALACYHARGLVPRGERRLVARVELPPEPELGGPIQPRLRLVDPGGVVEEGARPSPEGAHGLAPERRAGVRVDRRASLYEAGLILYELLAGSDSFGLGEIELEGPPSRSAPLSSLAPGLPLDLATFVMVLLRPYPDERPPSAQAALAALELVSGLRLSDERGLARLPLPAPCVGRAAELARLGACSEVLLARGADPKSAPRLIVLAGAPGSGRRRLQDELALRLVLEDVHLVRGICGRGGQPPFGPLAEALGRLIGTPALPAIPAEAAWALRALFPERAAELPAGPTPPPLSAPGARRERLRAALLTLLRAAAAARPLAILLEDLERARPETLELLGELARAARLGGDRLLIVGTCSEAPLGLSGPAVEVLHLAPLEGEAVQGLAAELLGAPPSPELAELLSLESEGLPGRVLELVSRHLTPTPPELPLADALDDALRALGRPAEVTLLAQATRSSPTLVEATLGTLLLRGRVQRRGDLWEGEGLGQAERPETSARLARFLAAARGETSHAARLEVAEQAARGDEAALLSEHAELAVGYLRSLSCEERAAALALECARLAADTPTRLRWEERAARLLLEADETERAEQLLRGLIDEPAERDPEQQAELWLTLTGGLLLREQEREARAALSWAHTYLRSESPPLLRAQVAAQAARLHLEAEEALEARQQAEAGLEQLKAEGPRRETLALRAELLSALGRAASLDDDLREASQMLKAALAIQEREGFLESSAQTLIRLGKVAFATGRWPQADAHWQAGRELVQRLGDRRADARLAANLGLCATRRGRYAEAEALLRESLELREVLGDLRGAAASLHNLAYVYRCLGSLAEAADLYRRALALRVELEDRYYAATGATALGEVLLEQGDAAQARPFLRQAVESLQALGDRRGEAAAHAVLAELERRRGHHDAALERLALVERIRSEQAGDLEETVETHRLRARIRLGLGQTDQARRLAVAAVQLTEENDELASHEAASRFLLGQVQARRPRGRGSARRELERARRAAERSGDRWTARAATIELSALRLATGHPEDARALLDSRPVPRPGRMHPLIGPSPDQRGLLRVRERLLRARIELSLEGGSVATARRCAEQALEEAQAAELADLEWRAVQVLAATAELRGAHERALELTLEAQEGVEALLAHVPPELREEYLASDPLRQAALRGDSPVQALAVRARGSAGAATPVPLGGEASDELLSAMVTSTQPTISEPTSRAGLPRRESAPELAADGEERETELGSEAFLALVRLNRLIVDEPNLSSVHDALLAEAVGLCGAERGFLVLFGESMDEARVLATHEIDEVERGQRFFRRCAFKAASSGQLVLSAEARVRAEVKQEAHLVGLGLRSVLATPVSVPDGSRGALYLDAAFQIGRFADREVELATALADLAALAIGRGILEEALHGRRGLPAPGPAQREYLQAKAHRDQAPVEFGVEERRLAGRSPALREAIERLRLASASDTPVLIWGPAGVGKGVAARALHAHRIRAGVLAPEAPLVVLDLRDLRADRIEAELFGDTERPGLLRSAEGGTLLLEHLPEAPLELQGLLLRTLEEGALRPLGSASEEPLSLCLVATTSEDPLDAVRAGHLHEPLALFLGQLTLSIPALDTRPEDKAPLAEAILAAWPRRPNEGPPLLSPAGRYAIEARSYAGNARELNAVLSAGVLLANGRPIEPDDLPPERYHELRPLRMALADYERRYVEEALLANRADLTATAHALGITRRSLTRKLKQLQITP